MSATNFYYKSESWMPLLNGIINEVLAQAA